MSQQATSQRTASSEEEECRESLSEVWSRYAGEIRRLCLRWTGGHQGDSDEAFSRVASVVFHKLPHRSQSLHNVRAWLLRITYNICIDLHRERRRKREQSLGDLAEDSSSRLFEMIDPRRSPEERILDEELTGHVRHCIAHLPPRLRRALELYAFEGLGYRQIAEALGITEVNARKRMQEARQKLRQFLEAYRSHGKLPETPPVPRPDAERPSRSRKECAPQAGRISERQLAALAAYVEKHPRGWKKRFELARLLRAAGRLEEAAAHCRIVVAKRPRLEAARQELSAVLLALETFTNVSWPASLRMPNETDETEGE